MKFIHLMGIFYRLYGAPIGRSLRALSRTGARAMSESLLTAITRYRWSVLLLSCFVLGVSALNLANIKIVSDFEVFFEKDNTDLAAYHAIQDEYTSDDNILFIVTAKDGNAFSQDTMTAVEALTDAAWTLPDSVRVDSLTNYQHTRANGDDLLVENLIEDAADKTDAQLAQARDVAINEVTLYKRLVRDGDVTGVNVNFEINNGDRNKRFPEIVAAARKLQTQFQQSYPGIEIRLVGKLINNHAFRESSLHDLTHLVPTAFVLALMCIAVFMWRGSRLISTALSTTFSVLLVILFSILSAQGIGSWLGIPVTPPAANAPTMILTLAIADSIHILVSYFQFQRNGENKHRAMMSSLRLNASPVFLTSATTLFGFLSLNFSDSPPFQDLGNLVAIGVTFAWLFSMTLLPAIVLLLPTGVKQVEKNGTEKPEAMSRLAAWVTKHYRPLLYSGSAVVVVFALLVPQNKLNDVWAEYFAKSTVQRQSGDYARAYLTSVNNVAYSLSSGESNGITDPEYLAKVDEFADWLRAHPFISHVYSFTDVMKRINKNMHGDDEAWHRLPDDRQLAAQYLLMYELSLPFGLDVNNQVNMDKSATKLLATAKTSSTSDLLAFQDDAQQWLKDNAPEYMYHPGASGDVMFAHIGQDNIRSMLFGTVIALIAISALIAIMLRSVRYGVISLVPNLAPAAIAFGLWAVFDGEIGLSLSVVVGMTLGIVVDYTIHFLSKYLRAKREQHLNTTQAIAYAFNTVGIALVVTTIILCVNFGVLAMSTFRLNSDMGMMTALTILLALLVDFFLLAPLLLWLEQKDESPQLENESGETQQVVTATE
ncbi:MAG: MMPL family transporter [Alcanivoracaceae bacterium]|nr:MMPL family transporter [Alcanivoracaceae bacterium]